MNRTTLITAAFVIVFVSMQLTGCSLMGFSGGQRYDAQEPDEYMFQPSQIDSIQKGAFVEVLRTDSVLVKGHFSERTATSAIGNSDTLRLMSAGDTLFVPVNEILTVRQPVPKSAASLGSFIGLMVDMGAVLVAMAFIH